MAAAIFDMTVLAGIGIKQWPQAIARGGRCRRNNPWTTEETITHAKV